MGDRGNVQIVDKIGNKTESVFLYTHWGGSRLPQTVQVALAKRWRWTDAPYLARIIFCEMVQGDEAGETGFGISTRICDNEHPIVVVDVPKQEVRFEAHAWATGKRTVQRRFSFSEYITTALPEDF